MAAALGQRFVHFALPAVPHSTLEVHARKPVRSEPMEPDVLIVNSRGVFDASACPNVDLTFARCKYLNFIG